MGIVNIVCCGKTIYRNYSTQGGEIGIVRCPECGCVYKWKDMGRGRVEVWVEHECEKHKSRATKK